MKKSGTTIFVNTPIETIKQRIANDTSRPLMKSNSLEELFEKRNEWYIQADHAIQEYEELVKIFD